MVKIQKGGGNKVWIGVAIVMVVILALTLGLTLGLKKKDGSAPPPPPTPPEPTPGTQTHLPDNTGTGAVCPSSVYVTTTKIINPASSSPTLIVNFDVSPEGAFDGAVTMAYRPNAGGVNVVSTGQTVDFRNRTANLQFTGALTPGWYNGIVDLTYKGGECTVTNSSPVSFFA